MPAFEVIRGQIPVGQGCFSFGKITAGSTEPQGQFLYVHDCGGQIGLIERAIKKEVLPAGTINALFISHFDEDHVRGIKHLLSKRSVENTYIPLLDETSRTIILASCKSRGIVSADLAEFVQNTREWLAGQGVKSVTEVSPMPPPDSNPDDFVIFGESDVSMRVGNGAGVRISIQQSGKITEVWQLKTFAYVDRDVTFRTKLNVYFGTKHRTHKAVQKWLLEKADSKMVKDFLVSISQKDHNRVSLCLFSGLAAQKTKIAVRHRLIYQGCIPFERLYYDHCEETGWLHTADFPFRTKKCKLKFHKYFEKEFNDVFCFMLSHHGASEDFKPELLTWMDNLKIGLVPVGSTGQYGHPCGEAIKALHVKRITPVLVMDRPKDFFVTHHAFHY